MLGHGNLIGAQAGGMQGEYTDGLWTNRPKGREWFAAAAATSLPNSLVDMQSWFNHHLMNVDVPKQG